MIQKLSFLAKWVFNHRSIRTQATYSAADLLGKRGYRDPDLTVLFRKAFYRVIESQGLPDGFRYTDAESMQQLFTDQNLVDAALGGIQPVLDYAQENNLTSDIRSHILGNLGNGGSADRAHQVFAIYGMHGW